MIEADSATSGQAHLGRSAATTMTSSQAVRAFALFLVAGRDDPVGSPAFASKKVKAIKATVAGRTLTEYQHVCAFMVGYSSWAEMKVVTEVSFR